MRCADFESAKCLLNSEVHLVLEHKMKASQGQQQKRCVLRARKSWTRHTPSLHPLSRATAMVWQQLSQDARVRESDRQVQVGGHGHASPRVRTQRLATRRCRPHALTPSRLPAHDSDLEKKGLHYFEVAQLGNLLPETTEEAKALIPSLTESKISTEQLSELLDELGAYRKFHA